MSLTNLTTNARFSGDALPTITRDSSTWAAGDRRNRRQRWRRTITRDSSGPPHQDRKFRNEGPEKPALRHLGVLTMGGSMPPQ